MKNHRLMGYARALIAMSGLLVGISAHAALLWGNNAGGTVLIEAYDPATGVKVKSFAPGQSGNGRGIVVVGNTVYYTIVGDGHIYELDATTGASLGSIATGQSSLSTISFDGTNFWLSDYSGTNKAYQVSQTGTLLKTITLANATGFTDGLEYFNGKLIANRSDGGPVYDIYDLNGALLTSAFITDTSGDSFVTGIAFDGANFFVSNATQHAIREYSGSTGGLLKTLSLTGFGGVGIEDLSFDFAGRTDTCGGPGQPPCTTAVPEPSIIALFLMGFFALGVVGFGRTLRRELPEGNFA